MSSPRPNRRNFLFTVPAAVAGAAVLPVQAAQSCHVSNGDVLGPFFLPGSAQNVNATIELAKTTEAGDHILITGRVLAPDCSPRRAARRSAGARSAARRGGW